MTRTELIAALRDPSRTPETLAAAAADMLEADHSHLTVVWDSRDEMAQVANGLRALLVELATAIRAAEGDEHLENVVHPDLWDRLQRAVSGDG